jgi:hypothetical protein
LIADWPLQSRWMAENKTNLLHPAAWAHGGVHFVAMLLVFHPAVAAGIAISHILIDTRIPFNWWLKVYLKTDEETPIFQHVAIWVDQVMHIACIAAAALIVGRFIGS